MFKNRAFQVKMVKDENATIDECTLAHYDAAEINTILTHQVKQVAIAVGSVYALKTLADTCSVVIIHAARTYIK